MVDRWNAVGVTRNQNCDIVIVEPSHHVYCQVSIETLLDDRLPKEVHLPSSGRDDVNEVGVSLHTKVKPSHLFKNLPLLLVPVSDFIEAKTPCLQGNLALRLAGELL